MIREFFKKVWKLMSLKSTMLPIFIGPIKNILPSKSLKNKIFEKLQFENYKKLQLTDQINKFLKTNTFLNIKN